MIEYLKHRARCFIFTASLAPAVAGGVLKALEIMQQEPERIEQLWRNTRKMHEGFKRMGFQIGTTETPIVPILIGSEAKAFQFTQRLFEEGVFATPAIYPAVRYGEAIVRTSYMATHTEEDLDNVLEVFARLAQELGTFDDPAYAHSGKRKANMFDFRLEEADEERGAIHGGVRDPAWNGRGAHSAVSR
jgi:8-amino-7-oxononanoate synthase